MTRNTINTLTYVHSTQNSERELKVLAYPRVHLCYRCEQLMNHPVTYYYDQSPIETKTNFSPVSLIRLPSFLFCWALTIEPSFSLTDPFSSNVDSRVQLYLL